MVIALRIFESKGESALTLRRLGPALWAATRGLLMLERTGHVSDDEAFQTAWDDIAEVVCLGFLTDTNAGRLLKALGPTQHYRTYLSQNERYA